MPRAFACFGFLLALIVCAPDANAATDCDWAKERSKAYFAACMVAATGCDRNVDLEYAKVDETYYKGVIGTCNSALSTGTGLSREQRIEALQIRGSLYSDRKEYDRAVADFARLIELDPREGHALRALAYKKLGDFDRAISDITQAMALDPMGANHARYYNERADLYLKAGKFDEARADLEKALALKPDNEAAKEALAELKTAKAAKPGEGGQLSPLPTKQAKAETPSAQTLPEHLRPPEDKPATLEVAQAETASTQASIDEGSITIEINKFERQNGQCIAHLTVTNKSGTSYRELKLDLVLFRPDGVIGDRLVADLAPFKGRKRTVKSLELANVSCYEVGRILINDVTACETESGKVGDCLKDSNITSLIEATLDVPATKIAAAPVSEPPKQQAATEPLTPPSPDVLSARPGQPETKPEATPSPPKQQAAVEPAKPIAEATPAPAPQPAAAPAAPFGKRVALVIGNADYEHTPPLANPKNDAADMAKALERLGFEVIYEQDLNKQGMDDAFRRFAREVRGADAALFYYAGHAMQFEGVNYLMPVDAKLADQADVAYEMAKLDDVVADMGRMNGVRIAVLDACRNNPLEEQLKRSVATTRGVFMNRGLARIARPEGLIVAYATQSGNVAADGGGRNSPFTAALLQHIETPGLEVGPLFRRVMGSVKQATGGKQHPELSILFDSEFYFKPGT